MQTLLFAALMAHIASGCTALGAGLTAVISRKGQTVHRTVGKIFFWSMAGVAVSAVTLAGIKGNEFLFTIALFAFSQNYHGWRAIRNKSLRPSAVDWVALAVSMLNGLYMIASGQLILMVFGGLGVWFSAGTLYVYVRVLRGQEIPKQQWLIRHIGMMTGAFIATVTAFLVVNVRHAEPAWIVWLLPTALGTPLIVFWIRRVKAKPVRINPLSIGIVCLFPLLTEAQPYVEGGNTRHRFAQLLVGADVRAFSGRGSESFRLSAAGTPEPVALGTHTETRIIVGGTHFWGHADFYLAFPVASAGKSGFSTSVEMGAKLFPWRIAANKIRPYAGVAMLPVQFQQGEGARQTRTQYPLVGGLMYQRGRHLLELGGGWNYAGKMPYYLSPEVAVTLKTQPWWMSLGYCWQIETTASAEKDWLSGRTRILTDSLAAKGKLSGLTLAAGPSSSFFIKQSPHNESVAPYAGAHPGAIFPEFGIGYYWHRPDVQFNLAWRSMKSRIGAYGYEQTAARKALTFEAFRFLLDYHGFVPFVGPALSYEWLTVAETHPVSGPTAGTFRGAAPGLTFGWDIRPNRLQAVYLRTNLRWFPTLGTQMPDGKKFDFSQIEFNFIEVVVFPGRF